MKSYMSHAVEQVISTGAAYPGALTEVMKLHPALYHVSGNRGPGKNTAEGKTNFKGFSPNITTEIN